MGLLNKFKSMIDANTRLDVDSRYEMLRKSVSGTMSQFRMARDRRTNEIVGLKILDSEKTAFFESRFKGLDKPSEGEIAIQFDHPNIVKTLSHGTTTSGHPYILMEFLPGKGLNSLIIAKAPMLDGKRLELMRQMTEAVAEVHARGFIHRDICPRNFICSEDVNSLKLIDFGLTVPATPEFMRGGNRTGTPQYMSPEVVRRNPTDPRVDIFSLGVTFYQLWAFDFPWPSSDMSGNVAMLHDQEPIDLLEFKPKMNPKLVALIHKCIEPKPENRPETAQALLRDLTKFKTAEVG